MTNFTKRFKEEDKKSRISNNAKKMLTAFAMLLTVVFVITGCTKTEDIPTVEETTISVEEQQDTVKVGDDGVDAGIALDREDKEQKDDSMISMAVEDMGRADPFLPSNEIFMASSMGTDISSYDLMPPPKSLIEDSDAVGLMATKVSGIMFDKYNPSAIIKIDDKDYLVRTGDIINGYKVLSIAKNIVTVQNGSNIFKAGVGELLTGDGINSNDIYNLEGKFGGNKNSAKTY